MGRRLPGWPSDQGPKMARSAFSSTDTSEELRLAALARALGRVIWIWPPQQPPKQPRKLDFATPKVLKVSHHPSNSILVDFTRDFG